MDTLSSESRFNGRFFSWEDSEVYLSTVDFDPRSPLLGVFMESHPAVTRLIVLLNLMIGMILRWRTLAQVAVSAIQGIAVFVVDMWRCCADDLPMEKVGFWNRDVNIARRVIAAPRLKGIPIPLLRPVKPPRANFGYFPFSEGHKAVRLIQRLNNRLAVHATLGHGFTSNEVAAFSRIPILATISGAAAGFEEAPCT